jgi:hypothetical protein
MLSDKETASVERQRREGTVGDPVAIADIAFPRRSIPIR